MTITVNGKKYEISGKKDFSKEFMLDYIKEHGTAADIVWFCDIMEKNHETETLNFGYAKGKTVVKYKYKVIREAFAKRFLPEFSDYTKRKMKAAERAKTQKKVTFEDELAELLEQANNMESGAEAA